jgi:hypothetical protein
MSTTFLLSQASPAAGGLLGLWRDEDAAVAFDAADTAVKIPIWRADLPGDPVRAANWLRDRGSQLRRCQDRLALADDRLQTTVDSDARFAAAFPFGEPDTVFAPAWQPASGWWQDASAVVARIAGRTTQALSPTMMVETRAGAELIGRSQVGLRGTMRTVWRPGAGETDALLHQTTVTLALSSRAMVLRMVAVVIRGATALALRLALPGGPLLALPTAWRFVQGVLHEAGEA